MKFNENLKVKQARVQGYTIIYSQKYVLFEIMYTHIS